MYQIPNNLEVW